MVKAIQSKNSSPPEESTFLTKCTQGIKILPKKIFDTIPLLTGVASGYQLFQIQQIPTAIMKSYLSGLNYLIGDSTTYSKQDLFQAYADMIKEGKAFSADFLSDPSNRKLLSSACKLVEIATPLCADIAKTPIANSAYETIQPYVLPIFGGLVVAASTYCLMHLMTKNVTLIDNSTHNFPEQNQVQTLQKPQTPEEVRRSARLASKKNTLNVINNP